MAGSDIGTRIPLTVVRVVRAGSDGTPSTHRGKPSRMAVPHLAKGSRRPGRTDR